VSQMTTDMFILFYNHNPLLSSFMTCHRVCNKSNTKGATSEQELLTLPEHLSSSLFLVVFVLLNL